MLTINDLDKRLPYTYKEIVEIDYPDYWNAANESVWRADAIQEMMGKVLPIFHDHLLTLTHFSASIYNRLIINCFKK